MEHRDSTVTEATPRETQLFCCEYESPRSRFYTHFFGYPKVVRVAAPGATVLKAIVREDPAGTYWAWWDNKAQRFYMVYPNEPAFNVCFPYGPAIAEQKGKGHKLKVSIEILGKAEV
jgi:hypothetical protein